MKLITKEDILQIERFKNHNTNYVRYINKSNEEMILLSQEEHLNIIDKCSEKGGLAKVVKDYYNNQVNKINDNTK